MATITRWTPFQQMERMQRDLDRLFGMSAVPATRSAGWLPPADVEQTDKATVLKLDLPGIAREDISIEVHDGSMTISGEREEEHTDEHEGYVVRERASGGFARSFTLPQQPRWARRPGRAHADGQRGVDPQRRVARASQPPGGPRRVFVWWSGREASGDVWIEDGPSRDPRRQTPARCPSSPTA